MFKTVILFTHLIATCIALSSILIADWKLFISRNQPLSTQQLLHLTSTKKIVSAALWALWISGIALISYGYWQEGFAYLENQKLWMKVIVVSILTINGLLLHRYVFNWLTPDVIITQLPIKQGITCSVLGAISSSSWLFAAFLGIARPWNHTISLFEISAWFMLLLAIAVITALGAQHSKMFNKAFV